MVIIIQYFTTIVLHVADSELIIQLFRKRVKGKVKKAVGMSDGFGVQSSVVPTRRKEL